MKIGNYIIALTALIAVSGCSKSSSKEEKEGSEQAFLSINTSINRTKGSVLTGTDFNHEAAINIIMNGGVSREQTYVLKKPTEAVGAWLPITGVGIKLTDTEESVYAHYPATLPVSSTFNANTLTLTPMLSAMLDFQTPDDYNSDNGFYITFKGDSSPSEVFMAEGEYDYMVGKGNNTVNSSNKEVSIKMQHNAAIVVVRVIKQKENTNPGVVKSICFANAPSGTKPLKRGHFAMDDNAFTPSGEEITYTRTMDKFAEGTYFAMMVYPATFTNGDVIFTLNVDSATYPIEIPAKEWKSGTILLYDITLKATSAHLNGPINVYDWDDIEDANKHNFPLE